MARCSGCSSDRCSCVIRPGANISVTGVGTPTNPYIISAQGEEGQAVPSGSIVMYAGDVAPAGWLVCNGSSISRTAYAALYSAIGVAFGAGDGSTTFGIPDMRERFPIGVGGTYDRGESGGAVSTVLTMSHIPTHTHSMAHTHDMSHGHSAGADAQGAHQHSVLVGHGEAGPHDWGYSNGPGRTFNVDDVNATDVQGSHSHNITVNNFNGSTGGSSAANTGAAGQVTPTAVPTLPPFLVLNFLIKT